MMNKINLQQN